MDDLFFQEISWIAEAELCYEEKNIWKLSDIQHIEWQKRMGKIGDK